jgi:hypothetical protein
MTAGTKLGPYEITALIAYGQETRQRVMPSTNFVVMS